MRYSTSRILRIACLGLTAMALPAPARACWYHTLLNLPEPVGIWPTDPTTGNPISANDAALLAAGSITTQDAISDAAITSWMINTSGTTGFSTNSVVNSVVSQIQANVQTVAYTSTNVYVKATGIPSHTLGSYGSDPAIPSNVNVTVDIPRTPSVNTGTKTNVGLGMIGVGVNGVAFFNPWDGMTYNNAGVWQQNANTFEASTFDGGPGHPAPIMGKTVTTSAGTSPAGLYHYHQAPTALISQVDPGNTGQHASSVIGFAIDGYPIFGPYGYANADGTGGVVLMTSSYALRNISTRTTLPNGTTASSAGPAVNASFPLGDYIQDYSYTAGLGTLDQYNGRFAVAPGYPGGTYGYYVTETAAGAPTYPYIIGPQYYGNVQADDLPGQTVTVPGNVIYYTPSSTPEPSCALLLCSAGMLLLSRRKPKTR